MTGQPRSHGLLRDWITPPPVTIDPDFQAAIGGHPLVSQILVQRGIQDYPTARAFIDPDFYQPASPEALPGMVTACERIERAIARQETICVWGDFDVDGQTSTTLLVSTLSALGARVVYHIPVRASESHGVNTGALKPILDQGVSLVVTCDTGITSNDAVGFARERGVDVIITDHHTLPDQLPEACATVTPRFLPEGHPLSGLPGVGVAYQLAAGLLQRAGHAGEAHPLLDLVALGIVADLAPQTGDTRYLLQRGLPILREARRPGLQLMFDLARLQPSFLTEEHIGFVLGPRLNALGRLDDANPIVEFFTSTDLGRLRVIATHLEGLNARRRLLTGQVLRAAQDQIEKDPSLLEQAALVLANPEWPAGVIGIVASELAERYNRPTILIANPPGQPAHGSARSIEGLNITEAIASQKQRLLGFGGHPMAAGLSLDADEIPAFRRGLSRYVEKVFGGAAPPPTLVIDGQTTLDELSLDLVNDLERLAPFGSGNPPLVLSIPRLSILSSSSIGRDGNHLQITVKDERDQTRRVLWWNGADWPLPEGIFDLACVIRASNYRGQQDIQVEWVDARPVETPEIELQRTLVVVDQREIDHPLPILQSLLADNPEETIVWGEAEAVEKLFAAGITARDRTRLSPAQTLVIWTSPPGRSELQAALDQTRPRTVVVFGVDPDGGTVEAFLKRLAGLVRFTLERRGGIVELEKLAAATAQPQTAIRLGLQWMQAKGIILVEAAPEGSLRLSAGREKDDLAAKAALTQLHRLLAEVNAYRHYFLTADKDYLV